MSCDHDLGICCVPFADDLTPSEFIRRLVHVGLLSPSVLAALKGAS